MKISGMKFMVMSMTTLLFLYGIAYSMSQYPRAEREERVDLTGTYTVIFHGGTYSNDPAAVAILDIEGDEYTIKPFTSEYNYRIKKGMPAEAALKESRLFISSHTDFFRSELQRIIDEKGEIIGYEVKPLYNILRFGMHDILDVHYRIKDKTVSVTVDIKRNLKRRFWDREFVY